MKIWPSMEQRSEAWFRARAGRLTASNFHRVLTPSGKDSSQWRELAIEMCCSRIRPDEIQWEGNRHTDRGEELEPEAREEFSRIMGLEVEQVGFIVQDNELVGCSPDGMIKINGQYAAGVELKCPLAKNHAEYLLDGVLPGQYKAQVHGSMIVTGLPYWYFMSYCRRLKPLILRVERDSYPDTLQDALERFIIYYADVYKRIMPILSEGQKDA